jgi:hypothetical protein
MLDKGLISWNYLSSRCTRKHLVGIDRTPSRLIGHLIFGDEDRQSLRPRFVLYYPHILRKNHTNALKDQQVKGKARSTRIN